MMWKVRAFGLGDHDAQSVRGYHQGHHHALRQRPRCFLSLWTTRTPSRPDACRTASRIYISGLLYCWNSEVGSKTLGIASFYLAPFA